MTKIAKRKHDKNVRIKIPAVLRRRLKRLFPQIDIGFCIAPDRRKTEEVVDHVIGAIPAKDRRLLSRCVIFAPSSHFQGEAFASKGGAVVYLAARVERESKSDIATVVAHELAHVVLGHYDAKPVMPTDLPEKYKDLPAETAARELAERWGFRQEVVRLDSVS